MSIGELGAAGLAKMVWRLVRRPNIARRMLSWDRLFKEGDGLFGYAYFVARKPLG